MFRKHKNKTAYAVIGLGRFGMALVEELTAAGADVVVMDCDEDKVRQARQLTPNAFVSPTIDEKSMSEVGVQNCDIAIVCISTQVDVSILVTLTAVNMGVGRVIAKASSVMHGKILRRLGAEVVYPERDMAERLANRLCNDRVLDVVHLSEQINISKLVAPEHMVGKTVLEANLRGKYHLNIIAVEHNGKAIDDVGPDYRFALGDILYLVGNNEGLMQLSKIVQEGETE